MIGQGQYGELQFGDRSLTWISSGEKTSKNITSNTSGVYSETTEKVNPTNYDVTITATSDVGDAIDISESLSESYTPTLTSDIGNATDNSLAANLAFSPAQAIDAPLSVDALITQYNYSPIEVSELATSIQKAIGSEQYGNFQWGAISVGLPTGKAIPTEYKFTPLSTEDIGNEITKAPKFTWNFSPQVVTDTGRATEKPDTIPWNYGLNIASELPVETINGQKPSINFEDVIAKLYSSAAIGTKYVGQNYDINQGDDTGIGIDDVEVLDFIYSSNTQDEIANTSLVGNLVPYNLSIFSADSIPVGIESAIETGLVYNSIGTSDLGEARDNAQLTNFALDTLNSSEFITVLLESSKTSEIFVVNESDDIGDTTDIANIASLNLATNIGQGVGGSSIDGIYTSFVLTTIAGEGIGSIGDTSLKTNYALSSVATNDIGDTTELGTITLYEVDSFQSIESIKVILKGESTDIIYDSKITSDVGAITSDAIPRNIKFTSNKSVDISNTTDSSSFTSYILLPITTLDEGWNLDVVSSTSYSINPTITSDVGNVIEKPESVGMTYEPLLVISEGVVIDTILITHDYNSDIIHKK